VASNVNLWPRALGRRPARGALLALVCTLITLWRCHPSARLIVALNRDEFKSRPTAPVSLWADEGEAPPIVAGKDLRAGGTWFGVGRRVVAGLTNQRHATGRAFPGERSRGELVVRALRAESVGQVAADLCALPAHAYGSFHLVAADADQMIWCTNRSQVWEIYPTEPGLHVLGNDGLDEERDAVVANLRRELHGAEALEPAPLLERLKGLLARGGEGWPCVDLGLYGTRSSAILWWGCRRARLWTTDGPPDNAEWIDQSSLLTALPIEAGV